MGSVRPYPPETDYRPIRGAVVACVEDASPADDAGIYPGCTIVCAEGAPVRDALDWQWASAGDELVLNVAEPDGEVTRVVLEREAGEPWGIGFAETVFDGVRMCRNDCSFCFMKQLPKGLRRSLYLRDDDFRLSFAQGTFVTLTNLGSDDIERIVCQRISPLRVSLHAVDPAVRRSLIGRHAQRGLDNLEALLDAGILFDAQVVLVPGANDGAVLDETLEWAFAHPGIETLGIVPLGYTDHQDVFSRGFDRRSARELLAQVAPFQARARSERGHAWAYASDEFYTLAFGEEVLDHLPTAAFYGGFSMFEDGIGIIRANVDEFEAAAGAGLVDAAADALRVARAHAWIVCGEAMRPYFAALLASSALDGVAEPLFVRNAFFGGNVDVTGLLAGIDIIRAIHEAVRDEEDHAGEALLFLVPDVVLNADGLTIDGLTIDRIAEETGERVCRMASNPLDYMRHIAETAKDV